MLFCNEADKIKGSLNLSFSQIYLIHIPKCSGTALQGQKYKNLGHCFNVDGATRTMARDSGFSAYKTSAFVKYVYPDPNNLKICIIRNPFDLLASYYFHGDEMKTDGKYSHSGWAAVNYTHKFETFDEFIQGYCSSYLKWHVPLLKQFMYSQMFDDTDKCVPDLILKYEYLNESLVELKKLSINLNRPKKNVSVRKTKNYKEYYTPELIDLVTKKCARELETFRYNFDNTLDKSYFILPEKLRYSIKYNSIYYDRSDDISYINTLLPLKPASVEPEPVQRFSFRGKIPGMRIGTQGPNIIEQRE
jgi:hypothetical protein